MDFKNSLDKKKTVKDITSSLYNFLIEQDVYNKLIEQIDYLKSIGNIQIANEYSLVWNRLIEIFDDIVFVLGEENVLE